MQVDHLCRQRDCVNPDHLEAVDNATNTQRGLVSKLNPEKVRYIRSQLSLKSRQSIAIELGISKSAIDGVAQGNHWTNIE
jgi:hypothetical protein